MHKKTHKLRGLGDVAAVVAAAPSLSVAAQRLGVHRGTLHRWLQSGKVAKRERPKEQAALITAGHQTAEDWAAAVRADATLTATEQQLIELAVLALTHARDLKLSESVRLAAMGRFQQLVRQLNLDGAAVAQPMPPVRAPQRVRTGTDPRAILMAVK